MSNEMTRDVLARDDDEALASRVKPAKYSNVDIVEIAARRITYETRL